MSAASPEGSQWLAEHEMVDIRLDQRQQEAVRKSTFAPRAMPQQDDVSTIHFIWLYRSLEVQ